MNFQSAYGDYPRGCRYKPTKTFVGCVHSCKGVCVHLQFSDTEIYVVRGREDLEVKRVVDGVGLGFASSCVASGRMPGLEFSKNNLPRSGLVRAPSPTWHVGAFEKAGPRPN